MTTPKKSTSQSAIRRHLLAGSIIAVLLTMGVAGWARTTEIAGAVIGMGVVVVDSNVKKVQHPTGGIVGELNVKNGYLVKAGDVLIRLNETQTRANLAVITKSLDELYARRARLEAEKDGAESLTFPEELLSREASDPVVAHLLDGERKLFALRADARAGQKKQLKERISQLREEVSGLAEQVAAKEREIEFIQEELKGVLELWEKNLVPITRVTALKRDAARLEGERGQLVAYKASTAGKIAETELQIIQVDEDARSKVAEELSDVRAKISELSERKISAEYELDHIDIRAPQSGRVHQLEVHNVGGVIKPGETIMLIVPDNDALSVEAKISPADIDQISFGQSAAVRFSAFNQRTTPEVFGTVKLIAADLTEDQRSGAMYYLVRVIVPPEEIAHLKGLKIIPGMPAEVFIQTGSRTILSYMFKPLTDQITRTFRETE